MLPATERLRGRDDVAGNIPHELDAFIGRERELARLRKLQAESRLLTLVGPGGVGKTRLALRLEHDVGDEFPDGTWLVDLSPIADPMLVPQALGDLLGVRQQPGQSMLGELTRMLRPRRLLLVLDNCEHLTTACADLVDGLLQACPNLSVVATSLQPLGAAAETTWRVPPLTVPDASVQDLLALQSNEAIRLFLARVRAHLPDFVFGEHNAQLVAEICRRLDGLPLALELVAARVESLGLAEVAARLSHRFELAVGANRTAPARQRTLQAALDWSCSLLTARELILLRRLSVFVGGWTLNLAETVCGDEALPASAIIDTLSRLVTKSLVVADHDNLTVRYRLLETVRLYALRQLAAAEETALLQRRHAAALLRLAEPSLVSLVDATVAATLSREMDNLRAALEWTVQQQDAEDGLRLATAAFPLWLYSGHYVEGNLWFERLFELPLAQAEPTSEAVATALTIDGLLAVLLADYGRAQAQAERALPLQRARDDTRGIGVSLMVLGDVALQRGDLAAADTLHSESARTMRGSNIPAELGSLLQVGQVASELGDSDRARQMATEVETMARGREDTVALGAAMHLRALVAAADGAVSLAAQLLEQALTLRGPDQQGTVKSLTVLGHVRLDLGQHQAALEMFTEAVRRTGASGERFWLIRALEGMARWVAPSNPIAAVRLAGATDAQRHLLGTVPWPSERRYMQTWLGGARQELGATSFQDVWAEGHSLSLAAAASLAEALSVEPLAPVASALSPRELEVAVLLAGGLTNKQIAADLVVSPATVRSHVEHILAKLDLRSRAQIAVWVSQQGLLEAPD